MKIVQINHFSYKAAGSIMMNLHHAMGNVGIDSYVVWGRGRNAQNNHEYYMGDKNGVNMHALYTRLTDRTGFASALATKKLISWLEQVDPDIIHLHCIHGYYINIKLLFDYIKKNKKKVIWTQHDCWAFTGHCAYFDMVGCYKWKTGCSNCSQLDTYPRSFFDNSKNNWIDKKRIFSDARVQLVTPCEWLAGMLVDSFLLEYPIKIIYNGVDCNVFHPTENNFKKKKRLEGMKIILGVASEWTERKGLRDFIKLDSMLDHDKYKIVIVGLSAKQLREVPSSIIAFQRTSNVDELVDIYSSSDLYFNPTYEDNFPTTNLEAIACGTPVITYKTGGAPEALDVGNGFVVEKGDLKSVIKFLCLDNGNTSMRGKMLNKQFSVNYMINSYLSLYLEVFQKKE